MKNLSKVDYFTKISIFVIIFLAVLNAILNNLYKAKKGK